MPFIVLIPSSIDSVGCTDIGDGPAIELQVWAEVSFVYVALLVDYSHEPVGLFQAIVLADEDLLHVWTG